MALARAEKVAQLKQDIHRMEGFRPAPNPLMNTVLGPLEEAFPSGSFPLGVLHEFLVDREHRKSSMAASVGFIAAMVSSILSGNGVMLWEKGQDTNDEYSLLKAVCDTIGRAY